MTTTPATPAGGGYLTAAQIAAELGVHEQTAQRYFREEGLPGRKIGHSWRTTRDAFDRWLTGAPPADADPTALETSPVPLEHKELR